MMIQVDKHQKNAYIWLTNTDQTCEVTAEQLPALIAEWKGKGFYPVVYRSGRANLYDLTFSLLKHNWEVTARCEQK